MDALKFVEERGGRTFEVVRKSYDDLHDRAVKLATLLIAGGGAMAAFALGKAGAKDPLAQWAGIAVLAVVWFYGAASLVRGGATSKDVPYGVGPAKLLSYYDGWLKAGTTADDALERTRREEIRLEEERVQVYADACSQRSVVIDEAYKLVAVKAPWWALMASAAISLAPVTYATVKHLVFIARSSF
ncbi:hypothetical protein [Pseudorhodoferax sp. Leaf274]|uniref:hypothetical protein n=1 Tax=Pseudorhodoferax sp. Leaf274 TaxID=1736318 RepID=UPI000702ED15|nr:hypothetical protein [Pseudorhodoferax sp. Leaf274]KQP43938.1 hypothetical protein ASF44_28845 [Pseudorhodoferax sp. Leaf274]